MFSPIFSIYNEKQEVIIPAKSIKRISNILKFFTRNIFRLSKKRKFITKNWFSLNSFFKVKIELF